MERVVNTPLHLVSYEEAGFLTTYVDRTSESHTSRKRFWGALLVTALLITGTLFATSAHACNPSGWKPVDEVFCEDDDPFTFTPPPSPYIEYNANLGFAVYVLADGSRISFDLARGTTTIAMAGGGVEIVDVSQLDVKGQRDFWTLAQIAASNPGGSFKLPIDHVAALGVNTPKAVVGTSSDEEMCPDDVSNTPTLPCVEAQLPPGYRFYFHSFYGSLRGGPIASIPAGAWVCSHSTRELCGRELQRLREQWEMERDKACFDRNIAIGSAVLGAVATPFACAAGGVLSLGIVTAPGGIAVCAATAGATVLAVLQALKEDARCMARWNGP